MPEDYCDKLLGTHWEGRFWASGNKVFWTVKCIEYPEYNEICVFVDGDKTDIPSMPVMGGKVRIKRKLYLHFSNFISTTELLILIAEW